MCEGEIMSEELKSCPFCGGEAYISCDTEGTIDTQGRMWAYTVVCKSCCSSSGLGYSVEQAIKAWNNRADKNVKVVPLTDIYRCIAGHSNYHGDNILSALTCIAEGKKVNPVSPLQSEKADRQVDEVKKYKVERQLGRIEDELGQGKQKNSNRAGEKRSFKTDDGDSK